MEKVITAGWRQKRLKTHRIIHNESGEKAKHQSEIKSNKKKFTASERKTELETKKLETKLNCCKHGKEIRVTQEGEDPQKTPNNN